MPDFSLEVVFIALSLMIAIFVMIESTLLERNGGKLLLKIVYLCSSVYQPRHGWWQRVWLGIFWILSVWAWW